MQGLFVISEEAQLKKHHFISPFKARENVGQQEPIDTWQAKKEDKFLKAFRQ